MNDAISISIGTIGVIAAIVSCGIAYWAAQVSRRAAASTQNQAERAAEANFQARQVGQSEAIIHFTSRFFDLMKDGPQFGDRKWVYQYWSLHATEFYFFHNSWIPSFMYNLWMVELASLYSLADEIWQTHENYLKYYSSNYSIMYDFFQEVHNISVTNREDAFSRNRKVYSFVSQWKEQNTIKAII